MDWTQDRAVMRLYLREERNFERRVAEAVAAKHARAGPPGLSLLATCRALRHARITARRETLEALLRSVTDLAVARGAVRPHRADLAHTGTQLSAPAVAKEALVAGASWDERLDEQSRLVARVVASVFCGEAEAGCLCAERARAGSAAGVAARAGGAAAVEGSRVPSCCERVIARELLAYEEAGGAAPGTGGWAAGPVVQSLAGHLSHGAASA
jgi:hypothetical protein